jgi:DNA-binding response OmpR family regulator
VLFVSGYSGEVVLDHEQMLPKPYTPESLLARVDELLAKGAL